ncbi:unnamed protein product [Lota lota]
MEHRGRKIVLRSSPFVQRGGTNGLEVSIDKSCVGVSSPHSRTRYQAYPLCLRGSNPRKFVRSSEIGDDKPVTARPMGMGMTNGKSQKPFMALLIVTIPVNIFSPSKTSACDTGQNCHPQKKGVQDFTTHSGVLGSRYINRELIYQKHLHDRQANPGAISDS